MKPLKILGIAVAVLAAIFVVAAIAAAIWFDPNKFRGQISTAVKDSTGRELTIKGDIHLRYFPWLGVKISSVTLGNAQGFGPQPFAEIGEAEVSVRLIPLVLHQQVKAGTVSLDGLVLNLAKDKEGHGNWEDLSKNKTEKPETPGEKGGGAPAALDISGLAIKDAALSYSDAKSGKSYKIDKLNLKTGTLSLGKAVDMTLSMLLQSADPKIDADLKLTGTLNADTDAKHYAFNKLKLDIAATGAGVPGGKQDVKLTGELDLDQAKGLMKFSGAKLEVAGLTLTAQIDGTNLNGDTPSFTGPLTLAPFSPRIVLKNLKIDIPEPSDPKALTEGSFSAALAATNKSAALNDVKIKLDQTNVIGTLGVRDFSTSAIALALKVDAIDTDRYLSKAADEAGKAGANKESFNETEIPVKALDGINADGSIAIGSLKVHGLQLADVAFKLNAAKGRPKTDELSAKLYSGTIQSHSEIIPGERPRIASKASLAGVEIGPLLKDLMGKESVSGRGNLNFDINSSGRTVRDVRHALNGTVDFNLDKGAVKGFNLGLILRRAQALLKHEALGAAGGEQQQTDFAELKGKGHISNGVLTTDYLTAINPAFRFAGEGTVDIGNEQINYLAKPTVVENTEGAGGKGIEELKGLTIPIRVTGSFDDPKYTIDIQEALKQKAASRLNQEIDKQKGRLLDKLGDFLNKRGGGQQPNQ